jgi:CrcB protein
VADPAWRLLLLVGFLGGYTTFSAFTVEALTLVRAGAPLAAAAYVLVSSAVGIGAVLLGIVAARFGAVA